MDPDLLGVDAAIDQAMGEEVWSSSRFESYDGVLEFRGLFFLVFVLRVEQLGLIYGLQLRPAAL